MTTQQSRPLTVYLLMATLLFQGLSGIAGGIGLVGGGLQFPLAWLEGSPFDDYLIPGLILLILLGIGPLIVLYGLWKHRYWGWLGALLVGAALIFWIAIEILIIGYQPQPPLQLIYGIVGIVIVLLALLPNVKGHFEQR